MEIIYTSGLRSVGCSVMMAIPKHLIDGLGLHTNQQVSLSISDGCMIVKPSAKRKYTLKELIDQCDLNQPMSAEERHWLDMPSVGREIVE